MVLSLNGLRLVFIVGLLATLLFLVQNRFEDFHVNDFHKTSLLLLGSSDTVDAPREGRRRLLEFLNFDTITSALRGGPPIDLPPPQIGASPLLSTPKGNDIPSSNGGHLTFLDVPATDHGVGDRRLPPPIQMKQPTGDARFKPKSENHLTFLDSISEHHTEKSQTRNKAEISIAHEIAVQENEHKLNAKEQDVLNSHPFVSPRKGTDISPGNQMSVLLCPNQSKCIVPELQLQKTLRIYFCKHPTRHGVRFYYLAKEGFLLHPNVILVSEEAINTADYIVYLPGSAPWHKTECNNPAFAKRLIVLDEFDGHTLFSPTSTREEYIAKYGGPAQPWYHMYFKRSFVRRHNGVFQGYPHVVQRDVYPMVYAIAEAYIPHHFNNHREIEILCTLRGSVHMTTRLRVQEWVAEYGQTRAIKNIISSQVGVLWGFMLHFPLMFVLNFVFAQVNTASRTTVSMQYFQQMYNSQIIVTVNPANWEGIIYSSFCFQFSNNLSCVFFSNVITGDFRLWESMATGALIFVDPVFVPHPYPLLDGIHVVYFSNSNKSELFDKLDYYRSHREEARRIAINGYLHAMKFHRTVNLIDYILRTVHWGNVTLNRLYSGPIPKYTFTGQYLNYEAKMQQENILNCHSPGIYEPLEDKNGLVKRLPTCAQK
jgi:hypothetical protein